MSSSGVNLENYLIPLDEIISATRNFSRETYIGDGGFGAVYRGQLSERWQHRTVAIKRRSPDSHQGEREFRNEIEMISRFHHENIISFIGYCDEGRENIIVYEYALNGSLDHHLEDPNKMSSITWEQRLQICIGAARGLQYLHSGLGERYRVIHRDIKSANILLDGNMVAKICDFGLSKYGPRNQPKTHLNTKVAGTQFYMDPTYQETHILRKESDVYSFGVVLFEILSGMLVYTQRSIRDEPQFLMNIVRTYHQNKPDNIIDPRIGYQIKSRSFNTFNEVAYRCISLNVKERPALDAVINKLEEAFVNQMQEHSASAPPADRFKIESLLRQLHSVSPYDQRIASGEICHLTQWSSENRVSFGQAGAIPRLAQLLTVQDSLTQEHALTALFNLSNIRHNKGFMISSGAVPGIVRVMKNGHNIITRENAAATIHNISLIDEAEVLISSAGAIPPLVLMLSKGTPRGKEIATRSLVNICKNNDNKGKALRAGAVPVVMELFMEPQGALKEDSLQLLSRLSWHPDGVLAIGEADAVPYLVEVIGRISFSCDEIALSILEKLCSMDRKYVVEVQRYRPMGKLKHVQQHGTDRGKRKSKEIHRMIKDYQHIDYGSDAEDLSLVEKAKRGALKISKMYDKITNIQL